MVGVKSYDPPISLRNLSFLGRTLESEKHRDRYLFREMRQGLNGLVSSGSEQRGDDGGFRASGNRSRLERGEREREGKKRRRVAMREEVGGETERGKEREKKAGQNTLRSEWTTWGILIGEISVR